MYNVYIYGTGYNTEKLYEFIDNIELTPLMVNSLIERIELDYTKIIDGKKTKNINIVYKFIDMSINLE